MQDELFNCRHGAAQRATEIIAVRFAASRPREPFLLLLPTFFFLAGDMRRFPCVRTHAFSLP